MCEHQVAANRDPCRFPAAARWERIVTSLLLCAALAVAQAPAQAVKPHAPRRPAGAAAKRGTVYVAAQSPPPAGQVPAPSPTPTGRLRVVRALLLPPPLGVMG